MKVVGNVSLKKAPFVWWFTGLSGAGKSTLAYGMRELLENSGEKVLVLDGDVLRKGLNNNLGFSREDRKENTRRAAELAKFLLKEGFMVLAAFISPFSEDRAMAKEIIGAEYFVEVFVDSDIDTCIQRDVKGLYKKAKEGGIAQFTGVSDDYEPPAHPHIHLKTSRESPQDSLQHLIDWFREYKGANGLNEDKRLRSS